MPEFNGTTPVPITINAVRITSVAAGDCIGLEADISVSFSNVNLNNASVGVSCAGAGAPADQPVGIGSGTCTFHLVHGAAASGHTITCELKQNGTVIASDSVGPVGIGNPCPISTDQHGDLLPGLPSLDPKKPLTGKFDATKGNRVILLVETPAGYVGQKFRPAILTFADPATVTINGKQGTWKHDAIKNAKKGQHLRVILTKDGEVQSTVRSVFK